MGNCNWSYRSDGTRVQRGGGNGEARLKGITALEKQINEIVNPQFDFEGSEKQKAWANDIVKQVYEGMIPKDLQHNISSAKKTNEMITKYPNETEQNKRRLKAIKYDTEDATNKFNKIKDSVNYEKAVYDGALKQLTASEIIGKRGNFKAGRPLNKAVYRNTYKSAIEKGKTPPTVEQGIKHFLKAFKNADEF